MAKKKKKKGTQSHIWSVVKWTAAIGGGAVIGAYTVRLVDRHLKLQPGSGLPGDEPLRENPSLPEAQHEPVSESPLANPLAMSVVSPVVPVPVAVPSFGGSMFGMPSPAHHMHMPPPPGHVYDADVVREAERESVVAAPTMSAKELREKRRAEKKRDFEELVRQFEEED